MSDTLVMETGLTTGFAVTGLSTFSSNDNEFFENTSTGGYLQAIKIEQKGKRGVIEAGNWSTGKDDSIEDFGEEIDCLVWARRAKAIDISDEENIRESFDSKSELFQEIHAEAQKPGMNGALSGPSYLIQLRSGEFYELFCTNKSSQKESAKLNGYLPAFADGQFVAPKPCTIQSVPAENKAKGYSWYAPKVVRCATPFDVSSFDTEVVLKKIQDFINPPVKAAAEEVEDTTGGRAV